MSGVYELVGGINVVGILMSSGFIRQLGIGGVYWRSRHGRKYGVEERVGEWVMVRVE